jgi:hypothetical protein
MLLSMMDKRGVQDGHVTRSEFLLFVMDGEAKQVSSPTRARSTSIWATLAGAKACWRDASIDSWRETVEGRGVLWASHKAVAVAEGAEEQFEVVVDAQEYPPRQPNEGAWA